MIRPDTVRPVLDRLAARLEPLSDAEALGRFTRARDQDAFARLVRRYAPLVGGVCRRVLGPRADADDAVQATFWALAKQAGGIRDPRTLPAWLHAVAYRAARRAADRSPPLPATSPPLAADDPFAEASWREVRQVLDEEVARLPQKLRLPILLCYFEELTRDEAAERLGWSLSTVKRRLDLARERLKARLQRRGVEPRLLGTAGLIAGGLSTRLAPALEGACRTLASHPPGAAVQALSAAPIAASRWLVSLAAVVGIGTVMTILGGQPTKPPAVEPKAAETTAVEEPLPPGAIARFGTTRYRADSAFWFGSFSKDGRWFVSGTDGVELWDLETGLRRQIRPVMNNTVPRPVLSPDGSMVAVLDGGPGIHLHDAKTGKEIRAVGGKDEKFDDARFTADGKRIVGTTHGGDPVTKGFDVADGKEAFSHKLTAAIDHRFEVWQDRVVLVVLYVPFKTQADQPPPYVRVVDVETGKVLKGGETAATDFPDPRRAGRGGFQPERGSTFGGNKFEISPDGAWFAYSTSDGRLGLAEVGTGIKPRVPALPQVGSGERLFRPSRIWFSPDAKTVFTSDSSGLIARIDVVTEKLVGTVPGHRGGNDLWHFDSAGKVMTTAGSDGQIRRWDLTTNREIPLAGGYATNVRAIYSADGALIVVGDKTGVVDVFDAKTAKLRHSLPRPTASADWCTFALSPDSRTLVATRPEGTILWWDVVVGKALATTPIPGPKPDQVFHAIERLAFSADGRRLAYGQPSGSLTFLDTATRKEIWRVGLPDTPIGADYGGRVAVSADGTSVVRSLRFWDRTGGRMGFALQVVDARTGEQRRSRILYDGKMGEGGVSDVADLAYTPDGRYLAVMVRDGRVLLLDPATLAEVAAWKAGIRDGLALGVSPDGRTLATGGDIGVTTLWEVATGKSVGQIRGHRGHLAGAAFAPDGRSMLTAGHDRVAYAWNLKPGSLPGLADAIDRLRGDDAEAARLAIWALANHDTGPALIRGAVKPADGPKSEAIKGWIVDLDSPAFAKREAASRALTQLRRFAEPAVREALAGKPTAEAKERLEKVVAALPKRPSADEVFQTRAVQALELAGTADGRKVLTEWASGPAGAWLTVEAKGAVGRLGGR